MLVNNQNSAKALFDGRIQYKNCIYPSTLAKPIDFWYLNPNYGFIDVYGHVIYPNEAHFRQVFSNNGRIQLAIDFVAEAFNDFADFYNQVIQTAIGTERDINKSKLVTVQALAAWTSPHKDYNSHCTGVFAGIQKKYTKLNKPVSFRVFLEDFKVLASQTAHTIPYTFMGYLSSPYVDPKNTGLIIEVYKDAHDDDRIKQNFLSDPNFEMFADIAVKHGFVIDKNAPWRLVADLNSPAMKPYLQQYGMNSAKDVFVLDGEGRFLAVDQVNMDTFRRYLVGYYNSIMAEDSKPEQIDLNETEWMELYVFVRQLEKNFKPLDNPSKVIYDAVVLKEKFGEQYASVFLENCLK